MKLKANITKRICSLLLIVGMLFSSSAFALTVGALSGTLDDLLSGKPGLEDVTGLYDGDSLRDGVFGDAVQKNKFDPDDEYWVLVYFGGESIADAYEEAGSDLDLTDYASGAEAAALRAGLEQKHNAFLGALDARDIGYTFKYSYSLLSDAVAIKVKYKDVEALREIEGVQSVVLSERYLEPEAVTVNDANVWGTGIYKTDGIGYDGNGLLVAVLDTGMDSSHAAFQTMPEIREGVDYLTLSDVADRVFNGSAGGIGSLGVNVGAEDVYYNAKIPFAFDYADKDAVVFPSYSAHGMHVAGIIAGNLGEDADEPITDGDGNPILGADGQPLTFSGVAPQAQLAICKVFTDREDSETLGGAETVDILAALEDCVKLGVDIINMSLGSSCGFSGKDDDHMAEVYESIRAAGISLVVAASNDYSSAYGSKTGTNLTSNPDSATVGSPSTFPEALSVASISGQKSPYLIGNKGTGAESFIFFTEASDGNGNEKEFVKEMLAAAGKNENDEVTLEYVQVGLYGRVAGYNGVDVKGKIALIQRGGDVTFEEKVNIAKMQGAIGCIIYNNVSGTIRMSIGNANAIPTCSITMDASTSLLNNIDPATKTGKITISKAQVGGPFMSDFSSWGPTPSLNLKPEITAHGGEITSCVTGGWDEYSGTSMAAPNMSGAMALVLQYLSEQFPEMSKNDRLTMANRLVMSATVIAYDEFGTPYSPRKQGAGLATIKNAIDTRVYLKVDGIDKTKLELGDDKDKTGVYVLEFDLVNFGSAAKTYNLGTLTMTETVSSDGRTVAEHAYMLDELCDIVFTVGGQASDGTVTVAGGQTLRVSVTITLNDQARKYLDDNFANGMYVEGFVTLTDTAESEGINLSIPWLAFYGDWHAAPMFDLSAYELADAMQDDSIPDEQKPQESVYATVPLGSYFDSKYIIPLGSYLYEIPESMNKEMYADEDKIAISMYDSVNHRTVFELYAIYAGLLRGAKTMDIRITDAVTGEVLYEEVQVNIRKAYSGGSATAAAAFIELEINPAELGLANNRQYYFEMVGQMDGVLDGALPEVRPEDSFSFPFWIDNEAPEILDYRVRFDAYKENNETKYRVYLDVDVYDNQYAQSLALCYLNTEESALELLTGDMLPIESTKGGVTTVSVEITDYYYSDTDIYLQVDDYALNTRAYRLSDYQTLAESVNYPDSVSFKDGDSVTIDTNEALVMELNVSPANAAATGLYWTTSNKRVVEVKDGTIFGVGPGTATVTVYAGPNSATANKASIRVTVTEELAVESIKLKSLSFDLIYNGDSELVDPSNNYVEVNPNATFRLNVKADPWYFTDPLDIRFSSNQEDIATVDENGVVHTLREGTAFITATQYVDGKPTAFSVTAKLTVGPEFDVRNGILYAYHGLGGKVTIPKNLNVYYIYEEAFQDNNNITELEISSPCMEIQLSAFNHMTALERVVIADTVTFVATGAFRNCPKLTQVDLRSRDINFSTRCFEGCTSLKYINNMVVTDPAVDTESADMLDLSADQFTRTAPHMGTLGAYAFNGCTALETVDLSMVRVSGEGLFMGCTALRQATLSRFTPLSNSMFQDCTSLEELVFTDTGRFDFTGAVVPFGNCRITQLTFPAGAETYYRDTDGVYYTDASRTTLVFAPQNLTSFTAPESLRSILPNAFSGNRRLASVNLGNVSAIGDYAFADCAGSGFTRVTIPASVTEMGEGVFYGCSYLDSADVQANVAVLPAYTFALCGMTKVTLGDAIVALGDYAFHYTDFATLDLTGTNVRALGNYVFSNTWQLTDIRLPALQQVGYGTFYHVYDSIISTAYPLQHVSFAEGTTDIGTATFYGSGGFPNLTAIDLPDSVRDSVTEIGDYTFAGCSSVRWLNLGSLTRVGNGAFMNCTALGASGNPGFTTGELASVGAYAFAGCAAITQMDLSQAVSIGSSAFVGTGLTTVDLSSCVSVGASAFRGTPLATITSMPVLASIGDYAFAETGLSGVFTLPASLAARQGAIGRNPFFGTGITALELEADNSVYFVSDGVLYSVLPNGGIQLDVCPPAYSADTFAVPEGVVRIGDDAFRSVGALQTVVFPNGVAAIGDKAFYGCSAKSYVFNSLSAPVLEAYLVRSSDLDDAVLAGIFDFEDGEGEEKYYANFSDYVAKVLYPELTGVEDLGLSLSYPANAAGFDNRTWQLFFGDIRTSDILAEPDTLAAIEAIGALPAVEDIKALTDMADREEAKALLTAYRETARAARLAFNRVTNADQLAFIENAAQLTAAEAAIRAVRQAFGENVSITELRVKSSPSKLTYVDGELFDAAGLVVTVIYDDGSQEDVSSGFVLPTEPLVAGQQTVTFYYQGVAKTISVTVNRSGSTVDPDQPGDSDPENPDNNPTGPANPDQTEIPYLVFGILGGLSLILLILLIIASVRRRRAKK